ncbi:hypothetical protein ASPZODRAFT_131260 [Penicilliopsis zonata CBS 506.65]|uniref:Zn(2)-C6 fungal-type domain-containing protein n=1 Tax=Penicilliopsis zonata CBS 506.65 TaxID=1073090 RepID=A0A1L9SKV4_9EURO|nr:hypothetical protein ASPZODRAFT_131260 [Penicilliopsis zonata CBS 506.65]OJJ47704.1 hypothetical protein ASPZODRAFT_131260 [Penicilliopsis zonata CBS 506.65]
MSQRSSVSSSATSAVVNHRTGSLDAATPSHGSAAPPVQSPVLQNYSTQQQQQQQQEPTTPTTTAQPPQNNPHSPSASLNARSCVTCRRRKVRCNKRHPCSNCVKAGIECIFPGPGRAPRKSKRPADVELLSRLRRLEGVIEQLSGKNGVPADAASTNALVTPATQQEPPATTSNESEEGVSAETLRALCTNARNGDPKKPARRDIDKEFGRLVIDEGRSRYVSNRLWASLGDEIEELQDILDPSSSDEEDHPSPDSNSTHSSNHDGFLFGFYSISHSLRRFHPAPMTIMLLWDVYKENVAPLVPIFHRPTVQKMVFEAAQNLDTLDKPSEALLFAIYLTAVVSLSPQQCLSRVGREREALVSHFRFASEQALARGNLLNTQNLVLLQAATLFLVGVRREDDTRFVWTMTAVILRLAQGLGLHRDGTNFGLKPYETEMRRRLWWHISLQDIRSSEDHGTDSQIDERLHDTRLPLNINDEDLDPDALEPPPERKSCTDLTFCLIRCEITSELRRLNYVCPIRNLVANPTAEERERQIQALNHRIEDRYIKYCNMDSPLSWVCATVARVIVAKLWLVVHHPLTRVDRTASLTSVTRTRMLLTSLEIVEFSNLLENHPNTSKWGWLFRTNMQWHAVAFVLAELCVRPVCPLTDRAWAAVSIVFIEWEKNVKQRRGMLWRPLSRLMKRAAAFRAQQQEELRAEYGPNPGIEQISTFIAPNTANPSLTGALPSPFVPQIYIPQPPPEPEVPSSTTNTNPTTVLQQQQQQQPGIAGLNPSIDIDLTADPLTILDGIFAGSPWPPSANGGMSAANASTASQVAQQPAADPMDTSMSTESAEPPLDWEQWGQVMREFQLDVEQAQAARPTVNNVSDWFV